jgi:hypothetical protein
MRGWLLASVLLSLGSFGCVGSRLVAAQAAKELHCPEKDISVTSREMGAYDARGCGKHASYLVRAGEVMPDSGAVDDLPTKMPNGED